MIDRKSTGTSFVCKGPLHPAGVMMARRPGWGEDGLCRSCRSLIARQQGLRHVGPSKPRIRTR